MALGARIPDADLLYRHAISPQVFAKGEFDRNRVLNLTVVSVEGTPHLEGSLAWPALLPQADVAHKYGCDLAEQRNIREAEKAEKKRRRMVYCGIYGFSAADLRALDVSAIPEVAEIDVWQSEENGLEAHVALLISLHQDLTEHIEGTITALHDRLWYVSRGPVLHTCDCDVDLKEHPNEKLEPGHLGGLAL